LFARPEFATVAAARLFSNASSPQVLPAIGHLSALRVLELANNPLRLPPERITRRGTIATVNYLRVLYESDGAPPEVAPSTSCARRSPESD
jgi:hypothetical protein